MIGLLSPVHLVFLAAILVLVFGGRRLPRLGRLAGTAIRTRLLGKPPAALLEPPAPGPGSHPVVAQTRSPALAEAARAHARQHALRTVLRRVPGPVGWIVRLLLR